MTHETDKCGLKALTTSASPREERIEVRSAKLPSFNATLITSVMLLVFCLTSQAGDHSERNRDFDYDPPAPGSYSLPLIKTAADGAVLDAAGKSLRLREVITGRITVMSFIYTRCAAPKACPYATGVLNELHQLSATDKALTDNMRLVSISFDPEYDTPQRLADYSENVREDKAGCDWRFITAKSRTALDPILAAYDQAVDTRPNENDPQGPLYHTLRVFLIDRGGRIRNIYSSATLDPRLVIADVKTLLLEERVRRR